jgi:hypothetical protein
MAKKQQPILETDIQDEQLVIINNELPTLQQVNEQKRVNKADEIIAILSKHGIEQETPLYKDLVKLFEKAKKAKSNEPEQPLHLFDADGAITHKWCIWHKAYEPIEDFAPYNRAKDGYLYECKLASKHWVLWGKEIKEVEQSIEMAKDAVMDGVYTIERGKEVIAELTVELNELKDNRANKIDNPRLVIKEAKDAE